MNGFFRFAIIGVFNTLLHNATVIALVEHWAWSATVANVPAYLVATVFSFWINSRWTFGADVDWRRFPRFVVVGGFGLAVTLLIAGAAEWKGLHYLWGQTVIVMILPVLVFVVHRRWTFR